MIRAETGSRKGGTLRVLHSTSEWLTLTKTWLGHLVRNLPEDEVESAVFCFSTANLDLFPVARVHKVRGSSLPQRALFRAARTIGFRSILQRLNQVIDQEQPEIVHSHFGDWAWTTLFGVQRAGLPHVVSFYGWDMSLLPRLEPGWNDRYHRLFEAVSGCLCEGPHMAAELSNLGCPAGMTRVQHLGVDLDRFPFRVRSLSPGEPLRVLITGSFREKKGIPDAMDALGRLHRSGIPFEVTVIGDAGGLPRGIEEKKRILAAVARNGLEERIRFLGYQPYGVFIEEAYRHHVFLSPSATASDGDTEGGVPVSILEMAATGMPVVTTTHCDIPYALGGLDGGGFFASERNPAALAEHLTWLFERPDGWEAPVSRIRAHLEAEYDWRVVGRRLLENYRVFLSLPGASTS